jgi:hypothetical protein
MKTLTAATIVSLGFAAVLNTSCSHQVEAVENQSTDDAAAVRCKKPNLCVKPDQTCSTTPGGTAKCGSTPKPEQVCASAGGTARCAQACVWKPVGGDDISIGRGPSICWGRTTGENDVHFVTVTAAGDDRASCWAGHDKLAVGATSLRSRGTPTFMLKVPAGRVLCEDNPGIAVQGSCTLDCLPE